MTSIIETAQAFLEQTKNLGRDAFKALYSALTPDVKKVYRQLSKAEFFTPERAKVSGFWSHLLMCVRPAPVAHFFRLSRE